MNTTSLNAIADSIEAVVKLSRVAGHKACALNLDAAESIIASLRKYQKEIYHLQSQWQLCPKCNGQGTVSKPPGVGGDVSQWTSDKPVHECDLCLGKKVIAPPDYEALKAEIQTLVKTLDDIVPIAQYWLRDLEEPGIKDRIRSAIALLAKFHNKKPETSNA